jgi:NAD(P)-dependent dehydrogenase (short-subunit alcohol dehydrogenase family)
MEKRFENKVALVTGAGTGIGRAIAKGFAAEGAKVVVNTRANLKAGEAVVNEIIAAGGEAVFIQGDVSKEEDVRRLIESTVEIYGRLDCAANNAGVGPDGERLPLVEMKDYSTELYDTMVNINMRGMFLLLKYEINQMLKQGGGAIVNTTSIAAVSTAWGFTGYHASKAGANKLTQMAAAEYATQNIRVNAVMPGPIGETLLTDNITKDPVHLDGFIQQVPMHRLGKPHEVANVVLFLASDDASFVTGHAVPVDGGMATFPNRE